MPETTVTYSALHWAKKAQKAAEIAIMASEGNGNNSEAEYAEAIGVSARAEEAGTAVGYGSMSMDYSTSYGYQADATGLYCGAFGTHSEATADYSLAIGYNAHAMGEHAIQIGYGNNTDAHTLKVALDQNRNVELLNENGDIPAERMMNEMITIGSETPTTATKGFLGKLFVDVANQAVYVCVGDSGNVFAWKKITDQEKEQ